MKNVVTAAPAVRGKWTARRVKKLRAGDAEMNSSGPTDGPLNVS
jgi:hypothetical protein